jgi:hypothetical protein
MTTKGLQGGINDPTLFPKWLDDNLYEGATFETLRYQRRPYIWINASDIYDRTPFVFGPALFGRLVQRSRQLSGLGGCRGIGGGAGGVRARRHSGLPGRLPDAASPLGASRAQQPERAAAAAEL